MVNEAVGRKQTRMAGERATLQKLDAAESKLNELKSTLENYFSGRLKKANVENKLKEFEDNFETYLSQARAADIFYIPRVYGGFMHGYSGGYTEVAYAATALQNIIKNTKSLLASDFARAAAAYETRTLSGKPIKSVFIEAQKKIWAARRMLEALIGFETREVKIEYERKEHHAREEDVARRKALLTIFRPLGELKVKLDMYFMGKISLNAVEGALSSANAAMHSFAQQAKGLRVLIAHNTWLGDVRLKEVQDVDMLRSAKDLFALLNRIGRILGMRNVTKAKILYEVDREGGLILESKRSPKSELIRHLQIIGYLVAKGVSGVRIRKVW